MPELMQSDTAIRQSFRYRLTNPCHQNTLCIHLMIPHIDMAFIRNQSDQMPRQNAVSAVSTAEHVALLLVFKDGFSIHFTIFCIAHRTETLVVVVDHAMNLGDWKDS